MRIRQRSRLSFMMIYPMRKHSFADDAAQQHLYETMLEFWKRELELGDRAAD